MKKLTIFSHIILTFLLILLLINTLSNVAKSRETLFSIANIAYVQKVGEVISDKNLSTTSIMLLAKEANLIKLSVRDSLGDNNMGKETVSMLEVIIDSLEEIKQLLEDDLDADTKIADLSIFVNQCEKQGRNFLDANRGMKFKWLIE